MKSVDEAFAEHVPALVIGGGPAGLAAAEALARAGSPALVAEAKPTVARKFLMAGKSGLNLTKDEPAEAFRAAIACPPLEPVLRAFGPAEAMAWAETLGEPVFTGSSGRVFPVAMKASPLLRRWLARLEGMGTAIRTRWRWTGWQGRAARFDTPGGPRLIEADATVLALGGASWPRLGSDAAWVPWLAERGVPIAPFRPANMGFDVAWSAHLLDRFAGCPVKGVALTLGEMRKRGEFVISRSGIEGSLVYALSAPLRDALAAGSAGLALDLMPDRCAEAIARRLARPRGRSSLSTHLRKTLGLVGVKAALLRDCAPEALGAPETIARAIKALPLPVLRPRPIAEAISSAGGIGWDQIDADLCLPALGDVYAAGEMLDWEAPTGGYLLTACLATGFWAGSAAARAAQKSR